MPVAASNRSNNDRGGFHITTSNFMDFNIARKFELAPNESVDINHLFFTRLDPLPVPTFGDAVVHNRVFFVPFRTIMPGYDDFDKDVARAAQDGTGHIDKVPYFMNSSIMQVFRSYDLTQSSSEYTIADYNALPEMIRITADLTYWNYNGKIQIIKFNKKGARFFKIYQQLGYGLNVDENVEDHAYSALPLLAAAKVYLDWYYPQAYIQDEVAQRVTSFFNKDVLDFELNYSDIYHILSVIQYVNYDADYFVSAWDNPMSPTTGSYSPIKINDLVPFDENYVTNDETPGGTPVAHLPFNNLTQFADDALHALSDYAKRNQIAGARAIDRHLARWGVTLPAEKLRRSVFVSEASQSIQFGDVTATASTDWSTLGDYAGKGIGLVRGSSSFSTDERGYIMIISTIVPKIGYFQGMQRENMHLTKLDFFTPEFDALGPQAISRSELFMPLSVVDQSRLEINQHTDSVESVFGFIPRYAEYKTGFDQLTGDFRLASRNAAMESWTLLRDLSSFYNSNELGFHGFHDKDFTTGSDAEQYDRIFNVPEGNDHFTIVHKFDIKSSFPGKALFDNYEYENGDKAKRVSVGLNGVKAN